jgi:hypothetical protein
MGRSGLLSAVMLLALAGGIAAGSASPRLHGPPFGQRQIGKRGVMIVEGVRTEGGAPVTFMRTIDLDTGHSIGSEETGASRVSSGYDGIDWRFENGIVGLVDVPAQVADARARAFVDREGWRPLGSIGDVPIVSRGGSRLEPSIRYRPPGGSVVEIGYDGRTGLPRQVVVEAEYGPVTTRYDDWRPVGPARYPYRQLTSTAAGVATTGQIERVRFLPRAAAHAFDRPAPRPRGHLIDGLAASIPVTFTGARQTHILVSAKISGHDAKMLFDTGGGGYLTSEAAKKFGLAVSGGVGMVGAGSSSSDGGYARIDHISLGSAEIDNQIVQVGPSPFPPGAAVDGLVGYEFLSEFRTTIDYAAKAITFAPFDQPLPEKGIRLPFYSDQNLVYVVGRIGGVEGLFRLDTGDGGTLMIFPAFAKQHGLDALGEAARVSGNGFGGQVVSGKGVLPGFSFAGLTFEKLPVQFSQSKAGGFAARSLAGNLGAGILQCFRMTFDYHARFILFEPQKNAPNCGAGATVSES